MKIACPHCTQRLQVDATWYGKALDCPTCGRLVNIPFVVEEVSVPVASEPRRKFANAPAGRGKPKPRVYAAPWKVPLATAAVATVFIGATGFWVMTEWRRLEAARAIELRERQAASARILQDTMAATDAAAEESAVQYDSAKQVAEASPEVLAEAPPSEAELIARLASARSVWPAQLSLTEETSFPAFFKGRQVGEVKVPPGTKVDLVDIKENRVRVRFREGTIVVPHEATNLAQAAAEAASGMDAAAARAESDKAKDEFAAPAKSSTPTGTMIAPARLVAEAGKIDALVGALHVKNKVQKPGLVSDERFLRRAYLTATGRIPTSEEAAEFLADKNPHKRGNLVASLVKSPGYASHMTNWMFDRLRIVDQNNVAQIRYPIYRRWVRAAIDQDLPWDKMVVGLLTARGGGWDEESAAVGYFTRDRGMPLDNLAVTMRIFLGSRMECAQCHNDPFGDTKQKDFFRLAAFTNGQDPVKQHVFYPIFREMDALPQDSVEHNAAWMLWRDVYGNSLGGGGTGRIPLPADYQYKDARPGDIEGARSPFGKSVSIAGTHDREDGRERLAKWITEGTEERFAGMIANGMWRRVMGAGFFEPGDDYLEPEDTYAPEISMHLSKLMQRLDYSLRDFQQTLMLTEVFQYQPNTAQSVADGGADDFRGRQVQRMTAEQVYDSLVTLVSGSPDNQPPRDTDQSIYIRGRPVLQGQMTMAELSRDVLAIEDERKLRKYFAEFVEKVKAEQEGGVEENMAATMRRDPVDFVRAMLPRASELQSPAPRNHFVALFGQSSRNIVDGSNREPNMGQVLSLMNGFVQTELVQKPDAHLNTEIERASDSDEKIRQLYLSIFSREPSPDEAALMGEEFVAAPTTAVANVASSMIMSAEFLYIQ